MPGKVGLVQDLAKVCAGDELAGWLQSCKVAQRSAQQAHPVCAQRPLPKLINNAERPAESQPAQIRSKAISSARPSEILRARSIRLNREHGMPIVAACIMAAAEAGAWWEAITQPFTPGSAGPLHDRGHAQIQHEESLGHWRQCQRQLGTASERAEKRLAAAQQGRSLHLAQLGMPTGKQE